jgi:glycosyltransferase involved in cell wall biosynthesis
MRISIVCSTLAANGIARAWILAQLLARHYEVEAIGGLRQDEEVWPGFADYAWKPVRVDGTAAALGRLARAITGDVVIAYGVGLLSFGTALLARRRRRMPIILDMPEWEVFDHFKWTNRLSRAVMIARSLVGPGWSQSHSFKYRYVLDHLTGLADERTVCCEFLRRRYGGIFLPQGPDTAHFDPARFDKAMLRRKWNIPDDATILFFGGNPQPNKGLQETVDALNALEGRVKARLVIVGRDGSHPYTKELMARSRGKIVALGVQPFRLMPELLATADLVALPLTRSPKSLGYVPCKIYEAMAMALPVISSDLSDVPTILDGCGYVVPADDNAALQGRIEYVLTHPDEAREMGRRARERVIQRYSWDVMDGILRGVVERLAPRARAPRTPTRTAAPSAAAG